MSRNQQTFGAALEYTMKALGGPTVETNKFVPVNTSPVSLAPGNGDRVGLVLVNAGAADAFVAPDSGVSANLGIRLGANGGNVTVSVQWDFTLPSREWFGICPAGGPVNIYVVEWARIQYANI